MSGHYAHCLTCAATFDRHDAAEEHIRTTFTPGPRGVSHRVMFDRPPRPDLARYAFFWDPRDESVITVPTDSLAAIDLYRADGLPELDVTTSDNAAMCDANRRADADIPRFLSMPTPPKDAA